MGCMQVSSQCLPLLWFALSQHQEPPKLPWRNGNAHLVLLYCLGRSLYSKDCMSKNFKTYFMQRKNQLELLLY